MGLFNNEKCITCGGKLNALTKAKCASGSICSSCLSICSPNYMSNIQNKSLEDIKQHMDYMKDNQSLYSNFKATDTVGKLLFVDKINRLFYVSDSTLKLYNKIPVVYSFDNILDYEVSLDGETITKGGASLGRAVVGGVLFGGVGAIIGGSTGKRKQKEVIKKMYIKISLNHTYDTYAQLNLITTDTKKGSLLYNLMTESANKIIAIFDSITASSSSVQSTNSMAAADAILKYKELLDVGAITEEEFKAKKAELLNI
ncbi:MAG: SHOCT domain-containing protein [Lachnotalea sp.]